ncbi:MAG TPA: pyruvate formate lyase family protein [Clostridia bacterium]|nr:pyruvate formate lyase family protein [Clostridia bacterium]
MGEIINNVPELTQKQQIDIMKTFTQTYKTHLGVHPAIREAMCLKVQFPAIMLDIREGDLFAGRLETLPIGFAPQDDGGGVGYYMRENELMDMLAHSSMDPDSRTTVEELMNYWGTETTAYKVRHAYPHAMEKALPSDEWMTEPGIAFPLYRMSGSQLDYGKLLSNGIPGMLGLIEDNIASFLGDRDRLDLFMGMKMAMELLTDTCLHYRDRALKHQSEAPDGSWKRQLGVMAETLGNIAKGRPETFREAIQLVFIYCLLSGSNNFGRMDTYLADYYVNDVDSGIITEDEALELLAGMWKLMVVRGKTFDTRVIVGGKGRENEANADRFALLAMEASRIVKEPLPQMSLRFYQGMNPELMEKALSVIGEGRTYPILYNDDVNIPSVMKAFDVEYQEAVDYCPFGCGEYILNHKSFGTPSGVINLLKALEVTLHNGVDPVSGKNMGLALGDFSQFTDFDELFTAYKRQVEYHVEALAKQEELEYIIAGQEAAYLFFSMLFDDCMDRGKAIFSGGVRYLGGTLETYGNINTSDSLAAIKEVVYDKKFITQEQLLEALDADFVGYEDVQRLLSDVPKYGNDDEIADKMAVWVHEHVCNVTRNQRENTNLHSYLVVVINNHANTILGRTTAASADGRKAFTFMANANNPHSGRDTKGITAMLNSLVKLDTDIHAGAVQNMKFSGDLFLKMRDNLKALLKTYFENGGAQAMISVLDRNDLEDAYHHPENHPNLMVRVGGFSARFVELDRDVQLEILERTIY